MPLLVIDDTPLDRAMIAALLKGGEREWLRTSPLDVIGAPYPEVESYRRYRAVILDRYLGACSGIDEARRIREKFPERPLLVLLTGYDEQISDEDRSIFFAVLKKGDLNGLLDTVRDIMRITAPHDSIP